MFYDLVTGMEKGWCRGQSIRPAQETGALPLTVRNTLRDSKHNIQILWLSFNHWSIIYNQNLRAGYLDTYTLHSRNLEGFLYNTSYVAYPITEVFKGSESEVGEISSEIRALKL